MLSSQREEPRKKKLVCLYRVFIKTISEQPALLRLADAVEVLPIFSL